MATKDELISAISESYPNRFVLDYEIERDGCRLSACIDVYWARGEWNRSTQSGRLVCSGMWHSVEKFNIEIPENNRQKATKEAIKTRMAETALNFFAKSWGEVAKELAIKEEERQRQREIDQAARAEFDSQQRSKVENLLNQGLIQHEDQASSVDYVAENILIVCSMKMRNRRNPITFTNPSLKLTFKGREQATVTFRLPELNALEVYVTPEGLKIFGERFYMSSFIGGSFGSIYRYVPTSEKIQNAVQFIKELDSLEALVALQRLNLNSDACLCCDKGLSDSISKAQGVGPECIKHFRGIRTVFEYQPA